MLTTGHAQIDADHARMAAMLARFRACSAAGDLPSAAQVLQDGMLVCLEHWGHEAELLGQTGWSQPIIQCHHDDHSRLEARMVQALIDLHAGKGPDAETLGVFVDDVCSHVATFDLPLAEALRKRQTDRLARKP